MTPDDETIRRIVLGWLLAGLSVGLAVGMVIGGLFAR